MPLRKCESCGKEISNFRESCSYCGAKKNSEVEVNNISASDSIKTESLMKNCWKCGEEISKNYTICPYCKSVDEGGGPDSLHKLEAKKNEKRKAVKITTGYNFETHRITDYIDVIGSEVVVGTGLFSEAASSISDFFGAQNNSFSNKLMYAREIATLQLRDKAIQRGANAIIGVDYDYSIFKNNVIGVFINGTAVTIKEIQKNGDVLSE